MSHLSYMTVIDFILKLRISIFGHFKFGSKFKIADFKYHSYLIFSCVGGGIQTLDLTITSRVFDQCAAWPQPTEQYLQPVSNIKK